MSKVPVRLLFFAIVLSLVMVLAACNENSTESDVDKPETDVEKEETEEAEQTDEPEEAGGETEELYSIDDFSNIKGEDETPLEGGELTFGLVSDTAFEGILNYNFYDGNPDVQVLQWFDEGLLTWDENYVYTNDGAATYTMSDDNKTATITIRDNVNWHDGEPVKAEDLLFAHEVIAHPDYDGIRFDASLRNVEGIEAYHNGEADTISGIEVVDEKTIKITYKEATPSLITGGIWTYPLAKHIFGDMNVADISSSPEVRQQPIGFGPYKVESIVPGESVVYSKNEDYWRGEPKLDKVTLKVINPNVVVEALKNGEVDIVDSFPVDQFPDNADLSNLSWLGVTDRAYTYIGFKLGKWDADNGINVYDPDAKMANVNLRKAMAHAVDNNTVGERFYHGLRWAGTTLIPPSHPEFHDSENEGLPYDPELAKQLLDEAGYVDVNGDNFREDPDGNELVINFASMSGGEIAEPLVKYYIQAWEQVGLHVEMLEGRLHEFNSFYDRVEADDPEIDIYQAAWSVGIDVDPDGLWGEQAAFNMTRWTNEENTRLIKEGLSEAAFDLETRVETYKEWQQLMVEEVPAFPTLYRAVLVPVNNRVQNYAIGDGTGIYRYQVGVSAEEPEVAE
ncbi:peptide/nickel transport system substrate-binding protein [Gracilibacillus ureilyticus]|uniref:Peptide/nickel transport system substrate-binding protein n=1 Tax=Gracilibacillus ureilyticus TaxID=531814 RepID=A0A1H9TUV2_9BACI|nr:oligopeptide ABC transporter substrate-binding protein [Gracilibacillus ureilyticus]SES01130.1 peptide/nickel transport system substrate-binding protein [Gracilibacillus ureilyticus]